MKDDSNVCLVTWQDKQSRRALTDDELCDLVHDAEEFKLEIERTPSAQGQDKIRLRMQLIDHFRKYHLWVTLDVTETRAQALVPKFIERL